MAAKTDKTQSLEALAKEIQEISAVVRFDSLILLMYAAEAVNRYLEAHMKKHGQDQTRLNILYLLVAAGGSMTPTNISKRVYRSKHAITRALDILEKDDLVKRKPSGNDRRSLNIVITEEGINLVKRTLPDLQRASSVATSCLTKEQIEQLGSLSRKLRKWLWSSIPGEA
jgi:DNA-binding MarR family transcriptional regulator